MGSSIRATVPVGGGNTGDPAPQPGPQDTGGNDGDIDVPEGVDPASIPAKYHRADGTVDWNALVTQHNYLEANRGPAPPPGTDLPPPERREGIEEMTADAAFPFVQEYQQKGALSETSYRVLEKTYGYTKAQVDQYVQGQVAQQRVYYQAVADAVGGREAWQEVVQWADSALTPDRLQFFTQQIHSGNQQLAVQAARSLRTEYEAAVGGVQGGLLQGNPGPGNTGRVKPYASTEEKDAALHKKNDKGQLLVEVDPSYRREHEARHMAMYQSAAQRRR